MIKKISLSLVLSPYLLLSGVVVPDDYKVSEEGDLSYIYGTEYAEILPDLKAYQKEMIKQYESEFGFKLDDQLRVGLATNNNQIANGFSTQLPFNSQLFYGAGASYIDYFCFSSWLKTLIVHETAHNFQLNPKENFISKTGHKIFGNSPVTLLGLFPVFSVPNIMESSFMFEGNAVMNESRFGNGGRLFSGYALAEVVALAKAGKITPQLMYNETLEFPYGEKFYLVGGFFQQFLVERYGIQKVNGYFKRYSAQPFPFFTNIMFKKQFGKSFETLLNEFVVAFEKEHNLAKATQGKLLESSQVFVPLNVQEDEILTLVGNRKSANKLFKFKKSTQKLILERDDWRAGEVFKVEGEYLTQSSANTSPVKIEMGLFDDDGFMKEGFEGKAVQGFMSNGKAVYFDVASSLETPQVYVDGVFYTESHSSVHVENNDIYYFKQEGEKRTLYKNREALYSFEGHYGFVPDVDASGKLFFVAASQHGSTIYALSNGSVKRVSQADDIIDFKLVNEKEALVATVGAEGYSYYLISLAEPMLSQKPYLPKTVAKVEKSSLSTTAFKKRELSPKQEVEDYNSLLALEYSSWTPMFSYDSYSGFRVDAYANFVDPLWQNQVALLASHDKERDILGLNYENSAHRLTFGGSLYGVFKNDNYDNSDKRDEGYDVHATFPWLECGYWNLSTTVGYTKAYDNLYREPLSGSLELSNSKHYGFSKYHNSLNSLSLFASEDRDVQMYGGSYAFKHDLPWQSYVGLKGSYMKSDKVNFFDEKGVELDNSFGSLQSDVATMEMPSLTRKTYAQEVKMGELSLATVFDASAYFYSFPLSIQRENLYVKQRRYEIDFSDTFQKTYDETTVGVGLDLLFLHKFPVPLSVEWIHNKDVLDTDQARVLLGGSF